MAQVTIKDIAEKAGVSKTIVSHFLNDNYKYMSLATKEKIAKIIKETNYIPKNSARNLKYKKIKVVNIIVANLTSSLSTQIIQHLDRQVNNKIVQVTITNSDDSKTKEALNIKQAIAQDVDAVILFPVGGNETLYALLKSNNIPVVFVDRIPRKEGLAPSILLDNQQAIESSIHFLSQQHHQQIVYLSLPVIEEITPRTERLHAFTTTMTQEEQIMSRIVCSSEETMAAKIETLLTSSRYAPKAFIASNDTCLRILLTTLKKYELLSSVDVVAIDGQDFFGLIPSIKMTIEHPVQEMSEWILTYLNLANDQAPLTLENQSYRFNPIVRTLN